MLFLKMKGIVHISKSSMRCLVFRKVSITMINDHKFLERIGKTDFLRNV